eukprot:SAG11_NODE_3461_length_2434_cov_1.295931_1_plen_116_part_00
MAAPTPGPRALRRLRVLETTLHGSSLQHVHSNIVVSGVAVAGTELPKPVAHWPLDGERATRTSPPPSLASLSYHQLVALAQTVGTQLSRALNLTAAAEFAAGPLGMGAYPKVRAP